MISFFKYTKATSVALAAIPLLGATGCSTQPPSQASEITFNAAGPKPPLHDVEATLLTHLKDSLKDPDSLKQFKIISGPDLLTWHRGPAAGGGFETAWLVCYQFNAKNAYGGYAGVRTDSFTVQSKPSGLVIVTYANWNAADRHC